jgi:hypothetical protein
MLVDEFDSTKIDIAEYRKQLINTVKPVLNLIGFDAQKELGKYVKRKPTLNELAKRKHVTANTNTMLNYIGTEKKSDVDAKQVKKHLSKKSDKRKLIQI